jgi:GNAT superfamily N-acetyltransferase
MATDSPPVPAARAVVFDPAPSPETRGELARQINAFHSRTVPHESQRFAFLLRAADGTLAAGLIGVLSWGWLFIEAVWVDDALRGQGVGRTLMARAETHALALGCHSAWLDTFQARDFYLALGYTAFGLLNDYPRGQDRHFLKKALAPADAACAPPPTRPAATA